MTNTDESAQALPTPAVATPDEPADLMLYVATVNVPGYSPMSDEPAVFRTAEEAWSYLASERERAEDESAECAADYSRTLGALRALASEALSIAELDSCVINAERCGYVYGQTPGYDGDHDLGLAYSVATDDTLARAADVVLGGYVEAMLWANAVCDIEECAAREAGSDCEHSNGAHDRFELDDFSADDVRGMRVDVHAMMLGADEDGADFLAYCDTPYYWARQFGHDFALTRNGHGAGYWDRGIGALGDKLTEWANSFGESHVNVTEDGVSLA